MKIYSDIILLIFHSQGHYRQLGKNLILIKMWFTLLPAFYEGVSTLGGKVQNISESC